MGWVSNQIETENSVSVIMNKIRMIRWWIGIGAVVFFWAEPKADSLVFNV